MKIRISRPLIVLPLLALVGFLLLGAIFFLLIVPRSDFLSQKVESLRVRVLQALPQPEHTEFLPTPLPTSVAVRSAVRFVTATPMPTETSAPKPTSSATTGLTPFPTKRPSLTPTQGVVVKSIQPSVQLNGVVQDYQRWNNCGPTTLS